MSHFRLWWKCSQWLPILPMIIFAIVCVVTNFNTLSTDDGGKGLSLFGGVAVGAFGTVLTIGINVASFRVDWVVVSTPEQKSLSTRRTVGWVAVGFRFIGVCVFTGLAAWYASPGMDAVAAAALGFVAAATNATAMGFSIYKILGPDRRDKDRRDEVAQGQQLGGYHQAQQWSGFQPLGGQMQYGWQPPTNQPVQQQQQHESYVGAQQWGNQQHDQQTNSLLPPPVYSGSANDRHD